MSVVRISEPFRRALGALTGYFSEQESSTGERVVMARAVASLFLAGGAIGVLSLALPQASGAHEGLVALVWSVAIVIAAGFFIGAWRARGWAFPVALASATAMIDLAIYWSGRPASSYAFNFVWVIMFSAYFMRPAQTLLQACWIAGSYPFVVSELGGDPESEQRWLLTVWTIVVVGLFIAILRRRVRGLIAKLSDAARTDPLTRLLNRRGFQSAFALELERSRRSGRACTLLLGDLDHFKRVNDLLGHPAGDAHLQKFARVLEAGKRRIDAAARMGGEEFAILLPETDEHGGYVIAERLRCATRDAFATDPVQMTVSFGVASYPRHGTTGDQLLVAADRALYVSKELGRDRSAIYRSEVAAQVMGAKERARTRSEGYLSAVLVLAESVDLRDAGTAVHSETVGRFAAMIAEELGLPEDRVERIRIAGVLHDIGKVGVPDAVLQKVGPLDEGEWEEMRRHCELGARLLDGAGLEDIGAWVLAHHERPDGLGYPAGMTGCEIPFEARILAVADAYEAMVGDRCYRPGIGATSARQELEGGAGTQFDADIVAAFLRCVDRSERALTPR